MDITEKIKDIVSVPRTFLLGVIYDKRLCILSDLGGADSLWALNQYSGELTRLTNGPVSWVALPPYFTDKLVFTRDVSTGKELQLIYSVEVDRPGKEKIIADMEPMKSGVDVEAHIIPEYRPCNKPKEQARICLLALQFLYREMFQKNQS